MTIVAQRPPVHAIANGTDTDFTFTFQAIKPEYIKVYADTVAQSQNSYTVIIASDPADGGTVRFNVAPANGVNVTIDRVVVEERTTDFAQGGDIYSSVLNAQLDQLMGRIQELSAEVARKVGFSVWETGNFSANIPSLVANKGLKVAPDGMGIVLTDANIDTLASDAQAAKTAAETARDVTLGYRDTTLTYKNDAEASKNAAASHEADSLTNRDKAHDWAMADEDFPVNDGTHAGFSAYHWAIKAQQAAQQDLSVIGFYYNDTADEFHFVEKTSGTVALPGNLEEWTILPATSSASLNAETEVIVSLNV